MRYQLSVGGVTSILDPGQSFFGSDGLHYSSAVLPVFTDQQLADIGVTKVADAPAPVPTTVSRLQAKQALLAAGLLSAVESQVAAGSDTLKIYWSDAADFHRDHPAMVEMIAAMGLGSPQVDALFVSAAQIA